MTRQERTATDVTPSQTLVQALQRRASISPVCQLQLIVRRRESKNYFASRFFGTSPASNLTSGAIVNGVTHRSYHVVA
jgi:hypothetical protein